MNQTEAGVAEQIEDIVSRWRERIDFCREWIKALKGSAIIYRGEIPATHEQVEEYIIAANGIGGTPVDIFKYWENMDKIFHLEEEIRTKEHLIEQREKQKEALRVQAEQMKNALANDFPAVLTNLRLKRLNASDRKMLDGIVERTRTIGLPDSVRWQDYMMCKGLERKYL